MNRGSAVRTRISPGTSPKLTMPQRTALRDDLRKGLKDGVQRAVIVHRLHVKYGVTPTMIRWYLRNLESSGANDRGSRPEGSERGRGGSFNPRGRGTRARILDAAERLTEADLRRAIRVRDLMKRLRTRRQEAQVLDREYRKKARSATAIERQIRKLIRS
jgi:hypothetical protein